MGGLGIIDITGSAPRFATGLLTISPTHRNQEISSVKNDEIDGPYQISGIDFFGRP